MSATGKLDSQELWKIGKVIAWSLASTFAATLLTFIPQIEEALNLPPEYAFIGGLAVNIANTVLYALSQWLKNNQPQ